MAGQNHFRWKYLFLSFLLIEIRTIFLRGIVSLLSFIFLIFVILWIDFDPLSNIFVPIPRFASNNVTSTVIEHGKKIRFLYISARISQRISLYGGISFYLTGWYFSRNLCFRKLKYLSWITSFFLIERFNIDTK